jgi:hypothetical protein
VDVIVDVDVDVDERALFAPYGLDRRSALDRDHVDDAVHDTSTK